ncbi:MAG: hypothetical protein MUP90_18240 [Gammaproteobacteria bacterium]|nr:hypothetical protein [Gammaproteobacteria bacterium]
MSVEPLADHQRWGQMLATRRSDYDVTNTVRVSSPSSVCQAVYEIFQDLYPEASFKPLSKAFLDFQRLFSGEHPDYLGCDTVYHDIQHTMDITLATARLIGGYERSVPLRDQIGPRRAIITLVTALFHDSGYIRLKTETQVDNGAELTALHVGRGASFLREYLPSLGLGDYAEVAARMVHYSGYEMPPEHIHLKDPKDRLAGFMLGTSDLMAQMADRCYLEKCRDRLYPEFVLAGIAVSKDWRGKATVAYSSGDDLVQKTRHFYYKQVRKRLDESFGGVHKYFSAFFGGSNPYQAAINKSIQYLDDTADGRTKLVLRRQPPLFTSDVGSLELVRGLVKKRLQN